MNRSSKFRAVTLFALVFGAARAEPPQIDKLICSRGTTTCAALMRVPGRPSPALQEWLARGQLQALPTQWQVVFITVPGSDPDVTEALQQQVIEELVSRVSALNATAPRPANAAVQTK